MGDMYWLCRTKASTHLKDCTPPPRTSHVFPLSPLAGLRPLLPGSRKSQHDHDVSEMNGWPTVLIFILPPQQQQLLNSDAKVKKFLQWEMKQTLHLISAPLLPVKLIMGRAGMLLDLDRLPARVYLEEGLRNTLISMLSWESVDGLCTSEIRSKKN